MLVKQFDKKHGEIEKGRGALVFQVERLQRIRQILAAQKSVSVIELSDVLDVSEITIRRDFEKLEKDGFLNRTHGGAVLNAAWEPIETVKTQPQNIHIPVADIPYLNGELGHLCVDILENYDVVFLTRTPSNIAMAKHLHEKNEITVVTNSLEIMMAMGENRSSRVLLTGGQVDYERWTLQMNHRDPGAAEFKVNKAFIHVQGIDFQGGVTVNDYNDVLLYEYLKQVTNGDIVIVVEGMVFGKTGLYKIEDLENIMVVVTDGQIPDDYKTWLYSKGVKIHQKFEL